MSVGKRHVAKKNNMILKRWPQSLHFICRENHKDSTWIIHNIILKQAFGWKCNKRSFVSMVGVYFVILARMPRDSFEGSLEAAACSKTREKKIFLRCTKYKATPRLPKKKRREEIHSTFFIWHHLKSMDTFAHNIIGPKPKPKLKPKQFLSKYGLMWLIKTFVKCPYSHKFKANKSFVSFDRRPIKQPALLSGIFHLKGPQRYNVPCIVEYYGYRKTYIHNMYI